jgi:hydroxyacylglutathione hydrolase
MIKILAISVLTDNYVWMLADETTRSAWVVDPGQADKVASALTEHHLELKGILLTHHHLDHSGGIPQLLNIYKNIVVCAGASNANRYVNFPVSDNQSFTCLSKPCTAFAIPGHTLDHTAFYIENALFCGDTLFSIGCGKVFEGTSQQMLVSLNKLAALPDDTQVYCGHEYTLANLRFAVHVEPQNQLLQRKLAQITHLRQNHVCTLPSRLGEEKKLNPFLRCTAPEIIQAVENHTGKKLTDPVEVFYYLREWKNNF